MYNVVVKYQGQRFMTSMQVEGEKAENLLSLGKFSFEPTRPRININIGDPKLV